MQRNSASTFPTFALPLLKPFAPPPRPQNRCPWFTGTFKVVLIISILQGIFEASDLDVAFDGAECRRCFLQFVRALQVSLQLCGGHVGLCGRRDGDRRGGVGSFGLSGDVAHELAAKAAARASLRSDIASCEPPLSG